MCGRYGFSVKNVKDVYTRFSVTNELAEFTPHYNIAPGTLNPVVTRHSPNRIEDMFWGLIPHWAKDDSFKFKTINARAEGIEDKPAYRRPFRLNRCLIPATGFYEWNKAQKPSQPFYFRVKDENIFAFAGLYDIWQDPASGKEIHSYTIITCQANSVVGQIHNRMPVILPKTQEDAWLNPDTVEPDRLLPLLAPFPPEDMESYPVSKAVNIPSSDTPDLIAPLQDAV